MHWELMNATLNSVFLCVHVGDFYLVMNFLFVSGATGGGGFMNDRVMPACSCASKNSQVCVCVLMVRLGSLWV